MNSVKCGLRSELRRIQDEAVIRGVCMVAETLEWNVWNGLKPGILILKDPQHRVETRC